MKSTENKKGKTELRTCWDFFDCTEKNCPAYGQNKVSCWEITGHRCRDKVFGRIEEKLIRSCFNCPFFKTLKQRMKGRRWEDITLLETLEDALIRSSNYSKKVENLYMEVIRRSKLMNLLSEVSKIITRLDKEEDIILAILTVITANEGLSYNRAFVFLKRDDPDLLRGKYALGPSTPEEAGNLWKVLEKEKDISIEKLVRKGQRLAYIRNSPLSRLTEGLSLDLNDSESIISKGISEVRFVNAKDLKSEGDKRIAEKLGLEEFCFCPIATEEERLGLVLVDNLYSGKEITPEDAHLLELVVSHATTSLRAAQLKESLETNIQRLKDSYRILKANEERMMKAERLAISGEMTSSVLHEIKNPLVSIGGFARNLYKSGNLSEKDREKAEVIMRESLRLEKYLTNLQTSVNELKLEEGDINQVIEETCQILNSDIEKRKIKLEKNLDSDISKCRFDEVKIHEVLLNIIQNSIEAVSKNGYVKIRTWQDESKIYVEISDNGEGIHSERLSKIFSPFYTTKEDGAGLGLAFARKIVQDHGGKISVSSSRGKGASFIITLKRLVKEAKK
ncbi:MAG: ATP-binding protein [Candidatus Krumholzibacteriota bacterium]|nr:ATP-binding protein [Candidatus Krumholzibacteriota bacterium]